MIPDFDVFSYATYAELTRRLEWLVGRYPHLATLEAIGCSHRGRAVWAVTLTNRATGPDLRKPAYYVDANIHADETSTSVVALYTIAHVLSAYGTDPLVTHLLDTRALYVLPRVNPDGGEFTLTTPYHWVGNGRYLPGEETPDGLIPHDVDGDGHIVQMRIEDPKGEWRISERDPRIMLLRGPGEVGGRYFRIYPEGLLPGYDGVTIKLTKPRDGNLNRQFPAGWQPDAIEYGAGDYPLSEPEPRAVAEFILRHPNIGGAQAYHTHGGIILHPGWTVPDSTLPPEDLAMFKDLGAVGTALTGYPVISVYHQFNIEGGYPRHGNLCEWLYMDLGLVPFTNEIWEPHRPAGITERGAYYPGFFPLVRTMSEDESLKFLAWNDRELAGRYFVDWHPYDHPQFGRVEIGGWLHMFFFRNPPPGKGYLEALAPGNCQFTLQCAASLPLVRFHSVEVKPAGEGRHAVRVIVENQGYLHTYLTRRAVDLAIAQPVRVELLVPQDAEIVAGPAVQSVGHLAGRIQRKGLWSPWTPQWDPDRAAAEWVVRARPGSQAMVQVTSEKGGVHETTVELQWRRGPEGCREGG